MKSNNIAKEYTAARLARLRSLLVDLHRGTGVPNVIVLHLFTLASAMGQKCVMADDHISWLKHANAE